MPLRPKFRRLLHLDRGAAGIDRALDEELRFHFDMTVRDLVSGGMSEADARREARARFGDEGRARAMMAAEDRERLGRRDRAARWQAIAQDVRYALRGIRLRPGFSIAVVATLALGIGANATMFGVVDRLLFRAPAYMTAPERVHRVYVAFSYRGNDFTSEFMPYRRYLDLAQWTHSFDVAAAVTERHEAIGRGEATRELQVGAMSASAWRLFDAKPVIGRFFEANEDRPPYGAPVAVLSYAFWRSQFDGSPEVLGRTLQVGPTLCTIIGVAPPDFAASFLESPALFIPITLAGSESAGDGPPTYHLDYGMTWLQMLVRRKPGVSIEQASADLTNAERRSYETQASDPSGGLPPIAVTRPHVIAAAIQPARGPDESDEAKVATWLAGVAAIVLLIACANVGNLLLGRALNRRREVAVRLALGVSRRRLLAQLLTESLVLAVLGGVAGVLLASSGGTLLRVALLPDVAWGSAIADRRVLAFATLCALGAGLLTGIAPVLQAGRTDVAGSLKSGSRQGTVHRSRLGLALLVAQAALSVVLLVGAGLFVRSFRAVRDLRLGYDAAHLVQVGVNLRGTKLTRDEEAALWRRLTERAAQLPGIAAASRAATTPFWMTWSPALHVPGIDSVARLGQFNLQAGSPDYFATAGTRILRGRGFDRGDAADAPKVVVVSDAMARALWPNEDAIGRCIRVGADTSPCRTVVGVAEDVKVQDLKSDPGLMYYMPIDQFAPAAGGAFVRTRADARAASEGVRRALQRLMPGAAYVTVLPMADVVDGVTRSWRLGATMFTIFGLLALVLASIGLYSVIAYDVAQRTHELGVRMALGAQARDVVALVLRNGLWIAAVGLAIGAAIALGASHFIAPLLFEVSPADPVVYVGVVAILLAVAVLASLLPAWRAARVDPSGAFRAD